MFYTPVLEKISALEVRISEVRDTVDALVAKVGPVTARDGSATANTAKNESVTTGPKRWLIASAVFLAAGIATLCNTLIGVYKYLLVDDLGIPGGSWIWIPLDMAYSLFVVGFYFAPLLFGFWVARLWTGRHAIVGYILLSLPVGAISLVLQLTTGRLLWFYWHWTRDWSEIDWLWSIGLFCVTPAAMFILGGIVGDFAEMGFHLKDFIKRPLETTRRIFSDRELIRKAVGALATLASAIIGAAAKPLFEQLFKPLFEQLFS
jgi:hypothetical protein